MPFRALVVALLMLGGPFAAGAMADEVKQPAGDVAASVEVVPVADYGFYDYGNGDAENERRARPDDERNFNLYGDDGDDENSARGQDDGGSARGQDDDDSWDIEEYGRTERA